MPVHLENSAWPPHWKISVFIPSPKKGNAKECSSSVQFSSVAQSCLTLCDPLNHSTPGLPVHHQLPEFTQTHVHRVSDAIQPSHPLSSPSPPAPNPSQKPLDESERGEWKCWLKAQHSENEDHGIWSHHFTGNRWGNSGNSVRLYFGGYKITADGDCIHEIKRCLLLDPTNPF